MTSQQTGQHPVTKTSAHSWLGRYEPVIIGLFAAVIFAVLSLVASAQDDLTVSEAITHFGTIAMMIAGGAWARNRVVSVESFNASTEQITREVRSAERAAIREELDRGIDEFTEFEQRFDPNPNEF